MTEPRTVTVKGWLARYQVRQHLELFSIPYSEDRRRRDSTFTVEADEEVVAAVETYAREVQG